MMPFESVSSLVIPLDRRDVDTDAILPKQYMAMIERHGFGDYLFDNWRYLEEGQPYEDCSLRALSPSFPLNDPRFQGAKILLCRANFGCGSSREHAVWALADWGVRALIAPSFADIFRANCYKNGILPVVLDEPVIDAMFHNSAQQALSVTIVLTTQKVIDTAGNEYPFEIDQAAKNLLSSGLDEIGLTLSTYHKEIRHFEQARFKQEPWLLNQPHR